MPVSGMALVGVGVGSGCGGIGEEVGAGAIVISSESMASCGVSGMLLPQTEFEIPS